MTDSNGPDSSSQDVGRLKSTFADTPFTSHGARWDGLWTEAYTPWDRGGPSLALADLLSDPVHAMLFAPSRAGSGRPRALVPGCGRGYDALLLAAFGYDVVGLDYSAGATKEAVETERKVEGEEAYRARGREGKGEVKWVTGDFFEDEWLGSSGAGGKFDLIFDYTFLCALPPEARPRWAKRMSQLLAPDGGRLVCLEWPLGKAASEGGPPWGLTAEVYAAHLARPGEDIALDDHVEPQAAGGGLKRLARIQPHRTHQAGTDQDGKVFDFISVWGR